MQFLINYVFVFTWFVTFLVPNLGCTPLPGPHFGVQAGSETLGGAQGGFLDDFSRILVSNLGSLGGHFRHLLSSIFCAFSKTLPGPLFARFGSILEAMLESFSSLFGDPWDL